MKKFVKDPLGVLVPLCMGLAAFWATVGFKILDTANIAWLSNGDRAQYYLAWAYYRWAPWTLPLTANPAYGLEISSSTYYANTVSLADLFFKPFSSYLPDTFQYLGLCLLLNYFLQGYWSWKLVGLFTNSRILKGLGSAFFLFCPTFSQMHGHIAASSHWTLLAAVYLCLSENILTKRYLWPTLLCVTATLSPYLLGAAGLIWLADLVARYCFLQQRPVPLFTEVGGTFLLVSATLWLIGFFIVRAGRTAIGYGYNKMNVLSFIDPNGWSLLLHNIPNTEGEDVGTAYLGLGMLLLCVIALASLYYKRPTINYQRLPLFLVLFFLTLFAITPNIGVGPHQFSLGAPDLVMNMGSLLRASGRMIWSVVYCLQLAVLVTVIRRFPVGRSILILLACLILQVIDISSGLLATRQYLSPVSSTWDTPMQSVFWDEAVTHYEKVRLVQPRSTNFGAVTIPQWRYVAYFAMLHKKPTDAAHFARVGRDQRAAIREKYARMIQEGIFDEDSLYIFDTEENFQTFSKVLSGKGAHPHLLSQIDGLWVFAPNWNNLTHPTS